MQHRREVSQLGCDTAAKLSMMQILKYLQRICSKRKCFMIRGKAVYCFKGKIVIILCGKEGHGHFVFVDLSNLECIHI